MGSLKRYSQEDLERLLENLEVSKGTKISLIETGERISRISSGIAKKYADLINELKTPQEVSEELKFINELLSLDGGKREVFYESPLGESIGDNNSPTIKEIGINNLEMLLKFMDVIRNEDHNTKDRLPGFRNWWPSLKAPDNLGMLPNPNNLVYGLKLSFDNVVNGRRMDLMHDKIGELESVPSVELAPKIINGSPFSSYLIGFFWNGVNYNSLINNESCPEINFYLKQKSFLSDPSSGKIFEELLRAVKWKSKDGRPNIGTPAKKDVILKELKDLKLKVCEGLDFNLIQLHSNSSSVEDYFSEVEDCLSYKVKEKYKKRAKTFLRNESSRFLNISATSSKDEIQSLSLGRVILTDVEIEGEKALYVAGFSGTNYLEMVNSWQVKVLRGIMEFAESAHYQKIFFDLNPQNRDGHSHEMARMNALNFGYASRRVMLSRLSDDRIPRDRWFSYSHEGFENSHGRKIRKFSLDQKKWTELRINRGDGLEGTFLFEGMRLNPELEPSIGNPDLIYDRGYACGELVEL